jgi:hypothetical protein
MTIKELIEALQKIREENGDDVECVISIDTNDAFNETYLDKYEALDTFDGYIYKVCLHGELIFEED